MMWNSERIDDALLARLPDADRATLKWVAQVREFAALELALEPGDSYTTYYDTGGRAITTVVVAAHPLALVPYQWRFPIAGQVPYLGYFDPTAAQAQRDRLAKEGWDTALVPASAFSTLGWIDDPVLSTMLRQSRAELADLLIHEITHRTVYFPGDTELNENLASHIAREGTQILFAREKSGEQGAVARMEASGRREKLRDALLDRLVADLDALYRTPLPDPQKMARKRELFAATNRALRVGNLGGEIPVSNAAVVLHHTYAGLGHDFARAQAALGGHPRDLVRAMKRALEADEPLEAARALLDPRPTQDRQGKIEQTPGKQ